MADPQFLLDSNICIYVLKDRASAAAGRLSECATGTAVVSAITYAEVVRGVDVGDMAVLSTFDRFFSLVPVLPFDQAAARMYAKVPFRRRTFDRLIAAHALSLGLTVVTNNGDDFLDIPGLNVENWAS